MKRLLSGALLALTFGLGASNALASDPGCSNSNLIGPKLVTDVCWNCLFPIRVAGVPLGGSSNTVPEGAADRQICACQDNNGVPHPGVVTSFWEPARLVEFQRVPGCSSVLNGTRFPMDRTFQGMHGGTDYDGGDGSFMHYHYYAFPLMLIMDMFVSGKCNADGYTDLDLMYLSELDPTWNNSELAFFTNPEAAAVANPIAAAACTADAVSSTAGRPLTSMFWCAGAWGAIYPISGHQTGGDDVMRTSSLLKTRVMAALHRRGLAWQTMGTSAMCGGGHIRPTLPKSQYKFSLIYPLPETERAHVIGESTLRWGLGRTIPGIGNDPIYTIWRWNDCCNW